MAKVIFRLEPTTKTTAQLIKGVKIDGSKLWARVAIAKGKTISQSIGNMLVKTFDNTAVAKSLRGQGTEDLPAHFGLNSSTAASLADGMSDLIRSSVRILTRSGKGSVSVRIQAVDDNWSEYLSLPGAQYISYPSKITIPVLKWLLIDPSIDIGQAAYNIVFEGENENFDVRIQKVSRSGRAIMVSLETLGGGGGYVLPAIISGQMGKNFIEMVLGQKNVAIEAARILMSKVK